jgi:hypothetical protein
MLYAKQLSATRQLPACEIGKKQQLFYEVINAFTVCLDRVNVSKVADS